MQDLKQLTLHSTNLFLQQPSHKQVARCGMETSQGCSFATSSPQFSQLSYIFSPHSDRLSTFGADLSDICGSVKFLTTFIVGFFQAVRSLSVDSISIVHSMQNLFMIENLRVVSIDHGNDQYSLQSSRFYSLTLLCIRLHSTSIIQARN